MIWHRLFEFLKSVQHEKCPRKVFSGRSFFRALSEYGDLQREISMFITNMRKYRPEKSLYLNSFRAEQFAITKITPKTKLL